MNDNHIEPNSNSAPMDTNSPLAAMEIKRPVIVIVGPTASGKSSLAQNVALQIDGEVVSADSMQVYRYMNIGTAKIPAEQQKIPHHLIDVVDPGQPYSAQLFQTQARAAFSDIENRGKVPILCGGTGFYVQAALEDMRFPEGEQQSNQLRDELECFRLAHGNHELWEHLNKKDSRSAALIHPNNFKRVIRALEMLENGVSYADQSKNIKVLPPVVPSLKFFLEVDPDVLRVRIDERVEHMRKAGLVEEVSDLLESGFEKALTAPQAIGYKEIIAAKRGEVTLDEAFERIKIATKRYAKRQRSWFRRDEQLISLDADHLSIEEMTSAIIDRYQSSLST